MSRVFSGGVLIILVFLSTTVYVSGQERQRIVNDLYLPSNAPVQIIGRELRGRRFDEKRLSNRTSGLADSDWIRNLTFAVKNVSRKRISYIRITLMVPKQGKMPGPMIYELSFGRRENIDEIISPGDIAKIKVRDNEYLAWAKRLRDWGVDDFDHVFLELRTVYFDDGTGWSLGRDIVRDPLDPPNWIYVDQAKPNPGGAVSFLGIAFFRNVRLHAGFFLQSANPAAVVCGWGEEESNIGQCQGCTSPIDSAACDRFDDDIFYLQPTGQAPEGFLTEDVLQFCRSATPASSNCGSCPAGGYTSDRFTRYTNCGQPQSCGQISTWGCVSPLVNVNGICQRSIEYQQACSTGYNSMTCACNPPPCLTDGNVCSSNSECCSEWCNGNTGQCATCPGQWHNGLCTETPIVVDILGNGFELTGLNEGVTFDLNANGAAERISWTSAAGDDRWLALDRDGNGTIDNGEELFGSRSPQPDPPPGEGRNGFFALAEFDKIENGGNGDGYLTRSDLIFDSLRLWRDSNQNGFSDPGELLTLQETGLAKLHLDHKMSKKTDEHGNQFRWRAKVDGSKGTPIGRWAWDVVLVTANEGEIVSTRPFLLKRLDLGSELKELGWPFRRSRCPI